LLVSVLLLDTTLVVMAICRESSLSNPAEGWRSALGGVGGIDGADGVVGLVDLSLDTWSDGFHVSEVEDAINSKIDLA
jgi:hypothetical protein